MTSITGGKIVVRALKAHGVTRIFSLPAAGIFPIYNACLDAGIEMITGRHEGAVVQTADGWSRVARATAVAVLPEGPGHANGLLGIAGAYAESSPVVVLSGIAETSNLGKGALQELPQVEMSRSITKWSALVSDIHELRNHLDRAFREAREGVPGPVHLSLPVDVLEQSIKTHEPSSGPDQADAHPDAPNQALIEHAIDRLLRAQRPLILAGLLTYWDGAGDALKRLIELTHIPLFTTERARGLISDRHPGCFGDGYTSVNPVAQLIHHADAILLLGEKIDCRSSFGHSFGHADVIQVWPDRAEIERQGEAVTGLAGDTGVIAAALLEAAGRRAWTPKAAWLHMLNEARDEHRQQVVALAASPDHPIHPVRIAHDVARLIDDDTILVFDGGDCSGWARFALQASRPGGWQTNTMLGHMGSGLPYALGAKLAAPASRVVLLTGDGALGFAVSEIETAVRYDMPIVIVVANDAAWGIEKYFQSRWYGMDRIVGTDLTRTRWDQVAIGMGAWGTHVERAQDLAPAIEQAFASGRPACIDVRIETTPSPLAHAFHRVFMRRRNHIRQNTNGNTG